MLKQMFGIILQSSILKENQKVAVVGHSDMTSSDFQLLLSTWRRISSPTSLSSLWSCQYVILIKLRAASVLTTHDLCMWAVFSIQTRSHWQCTYSQLQTRLTTQLYSSTVPQLHSSTVPQFHTIPKLHTAPHSSTQLHTAPHSSTAPQSPTAPNCTEH